VAALEVASAPVPDPRTQIVSLTAFGVSDTEGWTGDWLGAQIFFSSYPAETNSRFVREAGFTIERDEVVELQEREGPVDFQWVLACA
jgi:hypothetical protein